MLEAIPKMKELNIKVIGLHVHKGSGIHDAGVWAGTAAFLASFLPQFPDLKYLDLGGGLGVQYRDTDPPLDLGQLDAQVAALRAGLPDGAGQKLQFWLEPGRFIAATCGVLLAKVTQLKSKPGRSFVGISTGMNSLIRPSLYESHHDIVNLSRLPECSQPAAEGGRVYLNSLDPRSHMLVDVVGPICESGDVLGFARSLPSNTTEDDVILIDSAGAYGRVMSSNYNMREPAFEITLPEEEEDAQ
jgi:diaminopimelate decarboxylase/aspartate kinase